MRQTLTRKASIYGGIAAIVPKEVLAYSIWFWVGLFTNIVRMTIFVFFWRAVYADTGTLSGLSLQQTLNYILLTQIFVGWGGDTIMYLGSLIREGAIATELLRPLDFQSKEYVRNLAFTGSILLMNLPLAAIELIFFGMQLPTDPLVWVCFVMTLLLGNAVVFCFDWIFGCLAFYSTEVWGLSVLVSGIALFFSGALVPLPMLPAWLRMIADVLPFAQGAYVPIALLSGITPLQDVPRVWLTQLAWLVGLGLLSRLVFKVAVCRVTVQGG